MKRLNALIVCVALILSLCVSSAMASDNIPDVADTISAAESNVETEIIAEQSYAEAETIDEQSYAETEITEEQTNVNVMPEDDEAESEIRYTLTENDKENIEIITETLEFICSDPYNPLESEINFNDIMIGGKIPVFNYEEGGITESETEAYPLYSGAALSAIALVSNDVAQISIKIAEELLNTEISGNSISFIYDAEGLYVYDGINYKLLHDYQPVDGRSYYHNDDPMATVDSELVGKANLNPVKQVAVTSTTASTNASTDSAIFVSVGFQNQSYGKQYCWACADACIGNKITGRSISGLYFAQYFLGANFNTPASIDLAINRLNQYYSTLPFPYTPYGQIPTIVQIKYFLGYSHPIYGEFAFTGNFKKKHATVIRGADSRNEFISLMDPDVSGTFQVAKMKIMGTETTFVYTTDDDNTPWMLNNSAYPNYWA